MVVYMLLIPEDLHESQLHGEAMSQKKKKKPQSS